MITNDNSTPAEDIASQIPIGQFRPTDIFDASVPFTPTTSVEDVARGIDSGRIRVLTFGVPPL